MAARVGGRFPISTCIRSFKRPLLRNQWSVMKINNLVEKVDRMMILYKYSWDEIISLKTWPQCGDAYNGLRLEALKIFSEKVDQNST